METVDWDFLYKQAPELVLMTEDIKNQLSLQERCRVMIRQQLVAHAGDGQSILPLVHKLPLPTPIKMFLTFDAFRHYKEPVYLEPVLEEMIGEKYEKMFTTRRCVISCCLSKSMIMKCLCLKRDMIKHVEW